MLLTTIASFATGFALCFLLTRGIVPLMQSPSFKRSFAMWLLILTGLSFAVVALMQAKAWGWL